MTVAVGEDSQWGFFLLSSFTWKLNKDVDLTVHADERTDRGFGSGADLRYRLKDGGQGTLTGYYLNDAEPNKADPSLTIGDNRYRVIQLHHLVDAARASNDGVVHCHQFPTEHRAGQD